MARGRRKLVNPPVRKRINIPEPIANKVDLFMMDPLTGEVAYSRWSQYVTKLIRDDLERGTDSVLLTLANKEG